MSRNYLRLLALLSLALISADTNAPEQGQPRRYVAVNFDDLPVVCLCKDNADRAAITDKLLATFKKFDIPVLGVVNEQKLETEGIPDPEKVAQLKKWLDSGHELGNHGYSHKNLNAVTMDEYKEEILRNDKFTRPLAEKAGKPYRFFRHPFGNTGDNLLIRQELNDFLKEHHYIVPPNTITYQDYTFAGAYERAWQKGDTLLARRIKEAYLPYTLSHWEAAEKQTTGLFGHDIKQILVVHANRLNADAFGDVARMMQQRGYQFITTDEAMADPVYSRPDSYNGKIGVTWLSRWAAEEGKPRFYVAAPVPQFVLEVVDQN